MFNSVCAKLRRKSKENFKLTACANVISDLNSLSPPCLTSIPGVEGDHRLVVGKSVLGRVDG